jgi:NitT/TauT family transport system substrate-binding protein
MFTTRSVVFVLTASLLAAACGGATQSGQGSKDHVAVGVFGVLGDSANFIAKDRGYFDKQNIDVELRTFAQPSDEVPQVATGKVDVGGGAVTAGLFNALGAGVGIELVGDNASIQPGRDVAALVVRRDLAATLTKPADLKGRKVAIFGGNGTPSQIYLDRFLQRGGLSLSDVDIVTMPFPDMLAAMAGRAVDAAIEVEPLMSAGVVKGLWSVWVPIASIYPNQEANVELYSPGFAKRTDLARRFAVARLQGVRDYNDAFFKNKNKAGVVAILTKYTAIKDPNTYSSLIVSNMAPDGRVLEASLDSDQDWYASHGFVARKVDVQKAVDQSFADYANKQLGPYPTA